MTNYREGFRIGKHRAERPVVQGGMGVGVSGWELAGTVAGHGGVGTLSTLGLALTPAYRSRFLEVLKRLDKSEREDGKRVAAEFYKASAEYAVEEVAKAKALAGKIAVELGQARARELGAAFDEAVHAKPGPVLVNVMAAIGGFDEQLEAVLGAGADGIVTGAGIAPASIFGFAKRYPDAVFIPILSTSEKVGQTLKIWERRGKFPDAIVLEDPSRAGGHLGAPDGKLENVNAPEARMERAVPETLKILDAYGNKIPLIAAGGIATFAPRPDSADGDDMSVQKARGLGAHAIQAGTRFLATYESMAHEEFVQGIIDAKSLEDVVTYLSNAFMPARALRRSDVFRRTNGLLTPARDCRWKVSCLKGCAYCMGNADYQKMCILDELANVLKGGSGRGLMFTGTSAYRIRTRLSVYDALEGFAGAPALAA